MASEFSFIASFPQIQRAIVLDSGGGARVMLDVDETGVDELLAVRKKFMGSKTFYISITEDPGSQGD